MSKKQFSFTKASVQSVPLSTKQVDYRDAKVPHLVLRVRQRRVYYWYGRLGGKPKRVKIGNVEDLTIDQARRAAQQLTLDVGNGKTIGPQREAEKAAQKAAERTLQDLFDRYIKVHAKLRNKSWEKDVYNFDRYLSHWKERPLAEFSGEDFQMFHADLGARIGTTTANRIRAMLSSMFTVGKNTGMWKSENPLAAVARFPEAERERYLLAHELPRFFAELDADDNQDFADVARMALFTGARLANLLAMRWCNISLSSEVWTIPADQHKSGKSQAVPLSGEAMAILQQRQNETEFVFPSWGASGHLTSVGKWWRKMVARCGFHEGLRFHDLRRTLGSWQAASGTSLQIIAKTLGHTNTRTTQRYSRLDLDPVREAIGAATAAISEAGKKRKRNPHQKE